MIPALQAKCSVRGPQNKMKMNLRTCCINIRRSPYSQFQTSYNSILIFNTCTVHILLFCTTTNKCTIFSQIITLIIFATIVSSSWSQKSMSCQVTQIFQLQLSGQHDSSINIQTATTQTDFIRIMTTKNFSPFYCNIGQF